MLKKCNKQSRFVLPPKNSRMHGRHGAVAVEAALTLGIFVVLIFGIVEISRLLMVCQVLTNASREGARIAIVPGATDAQMEARVQEVLESAGIENYTIETRLDGEIATIETALPRQPVKVTLNVNYSDVKWTGIGIVAGDRVLSATVVMRKE